LQFLPGIVHQTLKSDGTLDLADLHGAKATDIYTLRGTGGEEVWEPRFTCHRFRYVEVTGYPGKPTLGST
jgi:alpha-L-rhamnosidase